MGPYILKVLADNRNKIIAVKSYKMLIYKLLVNKKTKHICA